MHKINIYRRDRGEKMLSKLNILAKKILTFILLFLLVNLITFENKVLSFHPCDCIEDRIIRLEEPLMEGEDISSLQKRLIELDFYNGPIDGKYGLLSEKAVKRFQKEYHLEENGVVDRETWNMLSNLNDLLIVSWRTKKPGGEISIIINLYAHTLSVLSDGKVYKTYPVTIGKKESVTPVGEWIIKNKFERIDEGPLGSRWMGLNIPWGVYGIHGTNKPWEIGVAASQGCIRLHNEYVEELFEWVEINTPVKIIGPKPEVKINKILKIGNTGYDVMKVQERLREEGFYQGYLNGIYDTELGQSIKELESQFSLKEDGITDENILNLLKLNYDF